MKEGSFFLSDQYDDLMRQALQWLTKQEPSVAVTDFSLSRDELVTGEGAELKVKVSSEPEGEVTVRYGILKDGVPVKEEKRSLKPKGEAEAAIIKFGGAKVYERYAVPLFASYGLGYYLFPTITNLTLILPLKVMPKLFA